MNEALAFHLLNTLPGCGPRTIRKLVAHFGSAEAAWNASEEAWQGLPFLPENLRSHAAEHRGSRDPAREKEFLLSQGIEAIPFSSAGFPTLLKEIPHPPALLYVRGPFRAWNDRQLIALVGSRKGTNYGEQAATELAKALSHIGYIVVSGLAFGIDSFAHEGALESNAPTVAVLGSGIDDATITPRSRQRLAAAIKEEGALLSEFAPGTPPAVGTFPARNRIMAGMCVGTIVVEAAEGSGSLITAKLALEYDREVFAVPGSIFSAASRGTNALLKEGAKIVTGIEDVIEELLPGPREHRERDDKRKEIENSLTREERALIMLVANEATHVDRIIELSRLETTQVNSMLTKLEMKGFIKNIGNMTYIQGNL